MTAVLDVRRYAFEYTNHSQDTARVRFQLWKRTKGGCRRDCTYDFCVSTADKLDRKRISAFNFSRRVLICTNARRCHASTFCKNALFSVFFDSLSIQIGFVIPGLDIIEEVCWSQQQLVCDWHGKRQASLEWRRVMSSNIELRALGIIYRYYCTVLYSTVQYSIQNCRCPNQTGNDKPRFFRSFVKALVLREYCTVYAVLCSSSILAYFGNELGIFDLFGLKALKASS